MRKNDGTTLIELLVSMAISVVVIAAAMTVLMMCARTQRTTADTMSNRNNAAIFMNYIKNIAEDGKITKVNKNQDGWEITYLEDGTTEKAILSYDASEGKIKAGNNTLLSGISSSEVYSGNLITASVTIDGEKYETSVRNPMQTTIQVENRKAVLLKDEELKSNYGTSGEYAQQVVYDALSQLNSQGKIIGTDEFYAEWYSNGKWGANTPWCACFVSWCLDKAAESSGIEAPYRFASCTYELQNEFIGSDGWHWFLENTGTRTTPQVGDIVLFNWSQTEQNNLNNIGAKTLDEAATITADHVGIVVMVDGNWLYTIEGNTSNSVKLWKYDLSRTTVIVGYERLTAQEDNN